MTTPFVTKSDELLNTVFKLLSLPKTNKALDDAIDEALNEIKCILSYYEKAAFSPPKKHSPAVSMKSPIRFINQMHIISKPKPVPYDPTEYFLKNHDHTFRSQTNCKEDEA